MVVAVVGEIEVQHIRQIDRVCFDEGFKVKAFARREFRWKGIIEIKRNVGVS